MGVYHSLCIHGSLVTFYSYNGFLDHRCWRCLELDAYLLYEVAH